VTFAVGTSGWHYADWRGAFYPEDLPTAQWLSYYATVFDVVEINNTFYHLPKESTFDEWREAVPSRFRFLPKVSRYLSHIKRLRDPGQPAHLFLERSGHLDRRRGPFLLQLPPRMKADPKRLDAALHAFGRHRVAVEFRDDSWFRDDVEATLRRHNAALVWTDRDGKPGEPRWRTAGWGYVRFHAGQAAGGAYGDTALGTWAETLRSAFQPGEKVYAFFNNDAHAHAVRNAARLIELLGA